ncbi:MAG: hypothetical protein LBE85_01740 [Candidatus Accumulibacter sp.]|nr:hypothetical protein [Accumulibacter sp.]
MEKRIGIVMNGVTGRVGSSQHLPNVMAEPVRQGAPLKNGEILVPDPIDVDGLWRRKRLSESLPGGMLEFPAPRGGGWDFAAAARGVDFIEACLGSAEHGAWEPLQGRI